MTGSARTALLALVVALVLAGCGSDGGTIEIDTGGDVVLSGSQAGYDAEEPACFVATDAAALERLWAMTGAESSGLAPEPPEGLTVPVVGVFLGQRPTAGYAVSFAGGRRTDGTVVLDTVVQEPDPGDVVAQVLTSPFVLLSLVAAGVEDPGEVEIAGDVTTRCETDVPEQEQAER